MNTNEKFDCYRCGTTMNYNGFDEDFGPNGVYVWVCPECGATHTLTNVNEEEQANYPYYNEDIEDTVADTSHGYDGLCMNCGHHIVWSSDFMRSEVWGDIPLTERGQRMLENIDNQINKLCEERDSLYEDENTSKEDIERINARIHYLNIQYSSIEYDEIDDELDSLASYCVCPHCGASIEIVDAIPTKENKE